MKKRGFTLIELLVVIAIIAMLLAILMPALNKVKKIAQRVVCGTNLKGLGTAQTVYANDYDDEYTVQGGKTNATLVNAIPGGGWQIANLQWSVATNPYSVSVGTSLYLLVREADVSPKSFVCPASGQVAFDGKNTNNLDVVQLWDFGAAPADAVSYAYHMPYKGSDGNVTGNAGKKARFAADGTRSAAFAVMADKNGFFDPKLTFNMAATQTSFMSEFSLLNLGAAPANNDWAAIERWRLQVANTQPHDREGQNILFADGHTSYETRTDVGVKNDNIYLPWQVVSPTTETQIRVGGTSGATDYLGAYGKSRDDSCLVNDGKW